ncbi:hypothetical protein KFK09_026493 [Dendrobium nobile]|uniref:Reverse transcriptase domain-containing protein n=1 Tax=Dendrobium nobile TaxID=94219 RepID=A0A8T3A8A2_DENNO|nr:hypothetical protein KFK09_026493 [Dendrobium nobile]
MNSDYVVGPDGFTTLFFQKAWHIIDNDILTTILNFFAGNPILKFYTSTFVVFIPKNSVVNTWNDFRHISLYTFFNKLISKIIMNHLTYILPRIISPNHMGFVKGRAITDNILLAQEFYQDLDVRMRGGNLFFKLDIAKKSMIILSKTFFILL